MKSDLTFEPIHFIYLHLNKPAVQAAGMDLSDATPPTGKIYPFSKIAVSFKPMLDFIVLQIWNALNL